MRVNATRSAVFAVLAVFVSVTPYTRKEAVPMMRWAAAAAMLFSFAFLASRHKSTPSALGASVIGAALLGACLCAWRAERSVPWPNT